MTRVIMEDSSNSNVVTHPTNSISQINGTQNPIYNHILKHTTAGSF